MTEVTIPAGAPAEDDKHVAAMVAKAEGGKPAEGEPKAAPTDGKPEWLGDFDSPEDMAKAYQELRAKMSKDGAPKAEEPGKPKIETPEGAGEATREDAAKAAEAANVDMSAIEAEFREKGELTAETYEMLQKAGFGKETVDAYIAGQQAIAEQMQSRLEEHVGGADKLEAALEWAKEGLSAEEVAAFNKTVDTADEAGIKLALSGLMAKYTADAGAEPDLVGGSVKGETGGMFRSVAELTAAMGDPRYQKDPAYRQDVEAKLARSSIF